MTLCLLFCFYYKSYICRKVGFQLRLLNVIFYGITVRLGTVSLGARGFMSIRNKCGRTLVNPSFFSANTWP